MNHRDDNPILIYVTDAWNRKVRVNKNALDDPGRLVIPVYNRFGIRIYDQKSFDPNKHLGICSIHKGNIVGTPEYEESQKAVKALEEKWASEEPEPAPDYPTVKGEGAPQYTFLPGKEVQLSLKL